MVIFPRISETVTSKKLIDAWDHSAVNIIVWCFSFKFSINFLSFSSPCFQRENMSPMHLQHLYGFTSISLKICASYSATNNILYDEANFVPIDVPRFFFKVFALKVKLLFLRTTSASSTSVEVVTYFSCLKSSLLHRAYRPS